MSMDLGLGEVWFNKKTALDANSTKGINQIFNAKTVYLASF